MRKKTICFVMGGHFAGRIGGAQFQAQCIVDQLKETRRFNIYYLARRISSDYRPDGYEILQIAKPVGVRKYSFAADAPNLIGLLRKIRPDVVYQRGLKAHTGIVAYFARKYSCRSVFHIASDRSLLPNHKQSFTPARFLRAIDQRFERYGLMNIQTIIAQTHHQAALLEKRFGRVADAIIPNFHPLPAEDLTKDHGKVRVIWVANFKEIKQPELFVKLAQDLSYRKDLEFVMIGRPGNPNTYKNLHLQINQTPNLTFTGELPIEHVNQHLAAGHLFVNTSRTEGFPNTFIQAWMRRVPTLTLSVNPDNLLTRQSLGYCGGTYENLREKVLELADDSISRNRMGEAAQRYALEMHSPKATRRLIEILERTEAR